MTPLRLRGHIESTLALLAEREAQLHYQTQTPGIDIALELLLQWEDWYRPQAPEFDRAFDPHEAAVLETFHGFFLAVRDQVGLCPPPIAVLCTTPAWQRYGEAARTTLTYLRTNRAAA